MHIPGVDIELRLLGVGPVAELALVRPDQHLVAALPLQDLVVVVETFETQSRKF